MVIVWSLLVLVVSLILWIVFIPVYLRINTDLNLYEIRQVGTVTFSFHPLQPPLLRMRLFGFRIDMTKKETKKKIAPPRKKERSGMPVKRSASTWLYLQRGILRSFRLKNLTCTVDLDDVVLSARLVPVLMVLSRGVVSVTTNFSDRNFLCLEMEGRVHKILWTTIRFFTKK